MTGYTGLSLMIPKYCFKWLSVCGKNEFRKMVFFKVKKKILIPNTIPWVLQQWTLWFDSTVWIWCLWAVWPRICTALGSCPSRACQWLPMSSSWLNFWCSLSCRSMKLSYLALSNLTLRSTANNSGAGWRTSTYHGQLLRVFRQNRLVFGNLHP